MRGDPCLDAFNYLVLPSYQSHSWTHLSGSWGSDMFRVLEVRVGQTVTPIHERLHFMEGMQILILQPCKTAWGIF